MNVPRRTVLTGLAATICGCQSPVTNSNSRTGEQTSETNGDSKSEATTSSSEKTTEADTLYHVSTIDALSCGHFSDEQPIGEVVSRGGFGLGTVNGLDGELVVVDGTAYAVRGDGTAVTVDGSTKTPFAAVTAFEPDDSIDLGRVDGFDDFALRVTDALPRTDHFYALNVEGTFEFLRTRSVNRQIEPYPSLEAVIENEAIFEFDTVEGQMPTFFIPEQFERIHPPGFHAHFITADRDGGGHVYDFRANSLTVEFDRLDSIRLDLADRPVESYPPC